MTSQDQLDAAKLLATAFYTNFRCYIGQHPYPKRWGNREKHQGPFDGEVFYQFKTCPNCGAEKSREV